MPSHTSLDPCGSREWSSTNYSYIKATGETSHWVVSGALGASFRRRKAKSWVNTPNFRQLIASGSKLPDNPFYFELVTVGHSNVAMVKVRDWGASIDTSIYRMPQAPMAHEPSTDWTIDTTSLSFKVLDRAKGEQFNVPVAIGEGRETIKMVSSSIGSLVNAARSLKRGNFLKAARDLGCKPLSKTARKKLSRQRAIEPTKAFANAWLAMSYGWIPLMGSVFDAVLLYRDRASQLSRQLATVTARARKSWTVYSENQLLHTTASGSYDSCFGTVVKDYHETARMAWVCSPTGANFSGQLGLLNPLEVAWELVPLSFVADWFIPIGDYFSSLDVPYRFTHQGGTIGRRLDATATCYQTSFDSRYRWSGITGLYSKVVKVERIPLLSIPLPRLSDLSLDPELGAKRITSGLSLLRQLLSSPKR